MRSYEIVMALEEAHKANKPFTMPMMDWPMFLSVFSLLKSRGFENE